jgi:protein-disulfide isomerase
MSLTIFPRSLNTFKLALLCAAAPLVLGMGPANAQQAALTKDDVKTIIQDYLKENPKVVVDALENYRTQQESEMEKAAQSKITSFKPYFTGADRPSAGAAPADAKVTIVEFFDYNCGYCKHAFPDVQESLKENKDVRVVFQDMPILSPLSQSAAKWALASHKQGKYFEFHAALMKFEGQKTDEELARIAKEVGLNVEQMKKDAESPEVNEEIEKSMAAAREIGIQGTPAFIVGDTLFRGYIGADGMKKAIEDARKAN